MKLEDGRGRALPLVRLDPRSSATSSRSTARIASSFLRTKCRPCCEDSSPSRTGTSSHAGVSSVRSSRDGRQHPRRRDRAGRQHVDATACTKLLDNRRTSPASFAKRSWRCCWNCISTRPTSSTPRQRDLSRPGRRPGDSRLRTGEPVLFRQAAGGTRCAEVALLIAIVRGPSTTIPGAIPSGPGSVAMVLDLVARFDVIGAGRRRMPPPRAGVRGAPAPPATTRRSWTSSGASCRRDTAGGSFERGLRIMTTLDPRLQSSRRRNSPRVSPE